MSSIANNRPDNDCQTLISKCVFELDDERFVSDHLKTNNCLVAYDRLLRFVIKLNRLADGRNCKLHIIKLKFVSGLYVKVESRFGRFDKLFDLHFFSIKIINRLSEKPCGTGKEVIQ